MTLETGRGRYRKYLPLAFTEHGAIMAATVLSSEQAIDMSIYVVRAFLRLRQLIASNSDLTRKLAVLERSVSTLDADTRKQFQAVYRAIRALASTKFDPLTSHFAMSEPGREHRFIAHGVYRAWGDHGRKGTEQL